VLERVLIDDVTRARLVADAREHVLRFGWDEVAQRTHTVYESLTGAVSRVV
jgi:glycogen synthase